MGSSEEELETLNQELLDLKNFIGAKEAEIANRAIILSNDMHFHTEVKRQVDMVDYKLQLRKADLETKKRQNALNNVVRIWGIKEEDEEDDDSLRNVVLAFLESRAHMILAEEDIDFCYRLVFSSLGVRFAKPKPIIVHFKSPDIQNSVVEKCTMLYDLGWRVVPELCEDRNQVRNYASKIFGRRNVLNIKGAIFVQFPDGSRKEFSTTRHLIAFQNGFPI